VATIIAIQHSAFLDAVRESARRKKAAFLEGKNLENRKLIQLKGFKRVSAAFMERFAYNQLGICKLASFLHRGCEN
jgi:hypothetical protein